MPSGRRPQPPVGTARVAISGHGAAGNPWVNVFWLNLTSTTHTAANLKTVIDAMVAAYATRFAPYMCSPYVQTNAKATWLYAASTAIEYAGSYNNAGSAGTNYETDALCAVINWSISDYYRGGHPRSYLAGTPSTNVVSGRTLVSSYTSGLATAATNWMSDVNALTAGGITATSLGTVRFSSGNAWLSPPVFRAYTAASVRSILGTQRRRYAA